MADILISCPVFGKAVPTGITTDHIILGSLNFAFTMQCPAPGSDGRGLHGTEHGTLASNCECLKSAEQKRKASPAHAISTASLRSSNQVSKPVDEDFELVRVEQEIYSDGNGSQN